MSLFSIFKTLLRSLFTKPETIEIKNLNTHYRPRTRGQIDIEINECIFCGHCDRRCPTKAIRVSKSDKKWEINRFQCIQCNCCAEVCPKKCLHMNNNLPNPSTSKNIKVVGLTDA